MLALVVLVLALVVAAAVVVGVRAARKPVAVASAPRDDDFEGVVGEPVPIGPAETVPVEPAEPADDPLSLGGALLLDGETMLPATEAIMAAVSAIETAADDVPPAAAPAQPVGWAKRFAPRGALDEPTRLGLIRDLGLVRAAWGVPLLLQAYDEEPAGEHRRAVLAALALYRHLDGRPVFERALRSDDEAERAIAGAALADLGVVRSLSS